MRRTLQDTLQGPARHVRWQSAEWQQDAQQWMSMLRNHDVYCSDPLAS
mgnify:CR=1 FL=1